MCEMNHNHATFINKKSQKQYMEAHHLIPIQRQGSFEYDIDVPENILCLCPNCHRMIHLADDAERKEILLHAYEKKKGLLPQRGIDVDFNALIKMYGIT